MLNLAMPTNIKSEEQFSYGINNFSDIISDLQKITFSVSMSRQFHDTDRSIIEKTLNKLQYLNSVMSDLREYEDNGIHIEFDFRTYVYEISNLIGNSEGKAECLSVFNCCKALNLIVEAIEYYHSKTERPSGFFKRFFLGFKA